VPTTSGGIRYPASTDTVNIPNDMANLANDVQTYINANALTTTGTYTLTNKTMGTTGLGFYGASGQTTFTTTLQAATPAANQTVTLPNVTGTVSLIGATETLSNKTFATQITINGSGSGATIVQANSTAGGTLVLPTTGGTIATTSSFLDVETLIFMGAF
jgi:hypothetical protein